jgi:hypothetical protein
MKAIALFAVISPIRWATIFGNSRFELPKPQFHLKFPERVNVHVDLSVKVQGIPQFPPIPSKVQIDFTGIIKAFKPMLPNF